jgi:hypothetical protein
LATALVSNSPLPAAVAHEPSGRITSTVPAPRSTTTEPPAPGVVQAPSRAAAASASASEQTVTGTSNNRLRTAAGSTSLSRLSRVARRTSSVGWPRRRSAVNGCNGNAVTSATLLMCPSMLSLVTSPTRVPAISSGTSGRQPRGHKARGALLTAGPPVASCTARTQFDTPSRWAMAAERCAGCQRGLTSSDSLVPIAKASVQIAGG